MFDAAQVSINTCERNLKTQWLLSDFHRVKEKRNFPSTRRHVQQKKLIGKISK